MGLVVGAIGCVWTNWRWFYRARLGRGVSAFRRMVFSLLLEEIG